VFQGVHCHDHVEALICERQGGPTALDLSRFVLPKIGHHDRMFRKEVAGQVHAAHIQNLQLGLLRSQLCYHNLDISVTLILVEGEAQARGRGQLLQQVKYFQGRLHGRYKIRPG
jgi:hypothetical protein